MSFGSVLVVLFSAAWAVTGLQRLVSSAPLVSQNAQSIIDREQLNQHMARLDSQMSTGIQDRDNKIGLLRTDVERPKMQVEKK